MSLDICLGGATGKLSVLGLNLGHLVVDDVEAEDAEGADLVLASAAGKPVVLAAHDPGKGVAHRISPALLL